MVRAPIIDRERLDRDGAAPVQTAGFRAFCAGCGYLTRIPTSYEAAKRAMRAHRPLCPRAVSRGR